MEKQSGVAPEILPLPVGGGAIRSIGETFSPDLHTGTGNYRIPLWFPEGPGGFKPDMALVYSSGAGNGPFGLGWRLPVMQITRQTERGLPTYHDERDTFLLDGEEIVPIADGSYRHRREIHFRKIERAGDGWVVHDKGGRRFLLGQTHSARIEHTAGSVSHTYSWHIEQAIDTHGNEINYSYRRHDTQLYLESITYGIYTVHFDYVSRPDAFTERRAGFDITTALRCETIEYHLIGDADPLVRRYRLTYDESEYSRISLLVAVSFTGHRSGSGGPESASFPILRFNYTRFQPTRRYHVFKSEIDAPPPQGLDNLNFDLLDLQSDAMPGVVQLDGSIHRYWPNKGHGRWGAPRSIRRVPAALTLDSPAVAFADMDGNGTADLLTLAESPLGYFENEVGLGWTRRSRFRRAPAFNLGDTELRLLDLNGDGRVDAMRTGQRNFYLYFNQDDAGWEAPAAISRIHDKAQFPDIFFSDPRVKLADMTGDGLADIVWVHSGRLDYWPHYGNGRFGSRVSLKISPSIGFRFDPNRLFLSDINGDGLTDVVYVESNRVHIWINRSGAELFYAGVIRHTPQSNADNVRLADMMGNGTWGLVWSYSLSRQQRHNYKYLDFTGGVRPFLLSTIDDGTGLITEIEYQPSTEHAQAAAFERQDWESSLPFPVQTVSRISQHDTLTGTVMTRKIRYFDGFFDGREREFRGFGRAEVLEEGDTEVPATMTISYFHQGRRGETPGGSAAKRRALTGRLHRLEVFSPDGSADASQPFRIEENTYESRQLDTAVDGRAVVFPYLRNSVVKTFERGSNSVVDQTQLVYDDLGNVIQKRELWDSGSSAQELVSNITYVLDTTRWILNLPAEYVRTDGSGTLLSLSRFYYDGDPFVGLAAGLVEKGALSRREEMALTDDVVEAIFGTLPPDYAALGYHRMAAPGGQQGWGVNSQRQAYDANGNVEQRMDALGNTGRIVYDANHIFPEQYVDPTHNTHHVTYDIRAGQVAEIIEPNGHATRYVYDPIGRLTTMIKPGDTEALPTTAFEYLDSTLPLGVRTRTRQNPGVAATVDDVEYFDGFQNTIQRRSQAENGQVIVDGWRRSNKRGWEAQRTPPFFSIGLAYVPNEGQSNPHKFSFTYDALGRIVETLTPDGRPSRNVYTPATITRYDVSDTDDSPENVARGHFNTPRREEYDARGRLLAVIEQNTGGASLATRFTYDHRGNLQTIEDARDVQTAAYTYDLIGRKIKIQHVDTGTLRVAHCARGTPALMINAADQQTEIGYDSLGRKKEIKVDGVVKEHYEYDAGPGNNLISRLARVQDEAGEVRYSYTPRGLVEEKTRQVHTLTGVENYRVQYAYDSMERMTRVTHPGGSSVQYHYNDRGMLKRIDGFIDNITYDAVGQTTGVGYVNGVQEDFTFDDQTFYLQQAQVTGPARATPYYQMNYTYDAVGNPLTITDNVSAAGHPNYQRQFAYDALYRLTSAEGSLEGAPFTRSYGYDNAGNFDINEEFRPEELYLVGGGKNQIRGIRVAGVETPLFDFDSGGNLISTPDMTLEFDARSRLIRVNKTDGTVVEYTYGYLGERVRKRVTSGGVTRENIYVDRIFEVRDGMATRFIYNEETRVASVNETDTTHFFHRDHLGNTVLITDEAGGIAHELGYYPFGNLAFSVGSSSSAYQFAGNEFDSETGLVYSRSRYYDPRLGRFVSPDLFVLLNPEKLLGLPANLNLYVYAVNNPMRLIDDEGSWWKWLVGALIIAALVIATVVVGIATGGAGFAFGILLAAAIGSSLGAGIGVYAAWQGGGDLADGFLFGALVGGAAGAAGYALGAAVGAAGISGIWGSILAGAAQGAIVGAGNGAIIGYAGGAGTIEDILTQAAIGFGIGAVVGGIAGAVSYSKPDFPGIIGKAFGGSEKISESSRPFWTAVGRGLGWVPQITVTYTSIYAPTLFIGFGSIAHAAIRYQWSDIQALCPEGTDCIIPGPSIEWDFPSG